MIYMLHSVGNTRTDWTNRFLSVKVKHLETLFQYLHRKRIQTYKLTDFINAKYTERRNGICLTFDDGFVDNWVFLFPLLQEYGIKATIFVSPEFVDPREIVRPQFNTAGTLEDSSANLGFLSWDEMKLMERSGLVDIESHSMSHTWYFSGSELVDFFAPWKIQKQRSWDRQYPWVIWNERPERKPFTYTENPYVSKKIGMPILNHGRSLGIRKFKLIPELEEEIITYCTSNPELFERDWFSILKDYFQSIVKRNGLIGEYETNEQMEARYWYELNYSKSTIEKHLNKEVCCLCWPGGSYNETSMALAEKAGYKAVTVALREWQLSNKSDKDFKCLPRVALAGNIISKEMVYSPSMFQHVLVFRLSGNKVGRYLLAGERLIRGIINK